MNSQGELFFKGKLLGKRNKISRACDECRKRKVKCDGVQPCSRCRKSNAECVFAKLPPKRGPPKQYMENLENRLQRVEKALSFISPRTNLDQSSSALFLDSNNNNSNNNFSNNIITSSHHRFAVNEIGQAYYVNDLKTRVDRIPSDNIIDTHSDKASVCDSSSSSTASLFHLPPAIITTHAEAPIPDHLSSRNLVSEVQSLTEIYFDHVHKYVPMIHKPSFLKQMHSATNPPSRLLLYAMCAVASRWSPDYLNHHQYSVNVYQAQLPVNNNSNSSSSSGGSGSDGGLPGYSYYQRALDLIDEFTDSPRLSTIQALVLLVKYQEYFQRPGYHHRSYLYLGIAVKMCCDLGLSQIEGDAYETETKRRTFWVTFMYDLFMSIEQGHACYFDTKQCKTGFPVVTGEEGPALEELIINQNIFIQLAKVLSEIYLMSRRIAERQQLQGNRRTREQEIEEQARLFSLHTHLENFLFEVPPSLMYPPTQDSESYPVEKQPISEPFIGFLHMTYHFSVILLHCHYSHSPFSSFSTSSSSSSLNPTTLTKNLKMSSTSTSSSPSLQQQSQQQQQHSSSTNSSSTSLMIDNSNINSTEFNFIPYQHRQLCANSASHITWITETMIEQYPAFTFSYPTRGIQHTIHCLSMAATIHKFESIHAEQEHTRQVANQQYHLSMSMIQKLARFSPCSDLFENHNNNNSSSYPMYNTPTPTPIPPQQQQQRQQQQQQTMFSLQDPIYPIWPPQQQEMGYMTYPQEDTRRSHHQQQQQQQQQQEDYDMDKQYMIYDPSSGMSQLFLGEELWENKTVRSEGHVMK